jgi:hypothetical protein
LAANKINFSTIFFPKPNFFGLITDITGGEQARLQSHRHARDTWAKIAEKEK